MERFMMYVTSVMLCIVAVIQLDLHPVDTLLGTPTVSVKVRFLRGWAKAKVRGLYFSPYSHFSSKAQVQLKARLPKQVNSLHV